MTGLLVSAGVLTVFGLFVAGVRKLKARAAHRAAQAAEEAATEQWLDSLPPWEEETIGREHVDGQPPWEVLDKFRQVHHEAGFLTAPPPLPPDDQLPARHAKPIEGVITGAPPGHARADHTILPDVLGWPLAVTRAHIEHIQRARDRQRWPELAATGYPDWKTGEWDAQMTAELEAQIAVGDAKLLAELADGDA